MYVPILELSTWRSGQAHCRSWILSWISLSLWRSSWSCFSVCFCWRSFSSYSFSLSEEQNSYGVMKMKQGLKNWKKKLLCESLKGFGDCFFPLFSILHLALLERLVSLGFCFDPVPNVPGTAALVLFGCWCNTSSSLAVVTSVSSLWIETERISQNNTLLIMKKGSLTPDTRTSLLTYTTASYSPCCCALIIYLNAFLCTQQEVTSTIRIQNLKYSSLLSSTPTCTMATSSWSCQSFCFAVWRWTFWEKSASFPRLLLRLDSDALSRTTACAPSSLSRQSSSPSSSFIWL